MGNEELPSSMAESALACFEQAESITCLLLSGTIESLKSAYNRAGLKRDFARTEPRPFSRTPRLYFSNEVVVLKRHTISLFRRLEIAPPPDSLFEISHYSCESLIRICVAIGSILGRAAITKGELPDCWDISSGLPEHPIKNIRDLSEFLERRFSEVIANNQTDAGLGTDRVVGYQYNIHFENVEKSLSWMGFNDFPVSPKATKDQTYELKRTDRVRGIVHHFPMIPRKLFFSEILTLIAWLRIERERQGDPIRRIEAVDQPQLLAIAKVLEQMSSLAALTNNSPTATPTDDITANVLRNEYSPWIKAKDLKSKLFPLNNYECYSPQTVRRRKVEWKAEFKSPKDYTTFRFPLSTLRQLGVKYPHEWDIVER